MPRRYGGAEQAAGIRAHRGTALAAAPDKRRLAGDTARAATTDEVKQLRREGRT